jgi:hypothetical protein
MMIGSSEYVVAARTTTAYEVLLAVVRGRHYPVVRSESRHLTVTFRPDSGARSEVLIYATVLDAGHGLSKIVVTGRDEQGGATIELGDIPWGLFAEVERRRQLESRIGTNAAALR